MSSQNVDELGQPAGQPPPTDGNTVERRVRRRALLTVPEVAFMLGCGRTLVYELIGSQQLPIVKIGRLTRVPADAVEDFVSVRTTSRRPPAVVTAPPSPRPRRTRPRAVSSGAVAQAKLFDDISGR
jgi:excisionase family DNA binding protein